MGRVSKGPSVSALNFSRKATTIEVLLHGADTGLGSVRLAVGITRSRGFTDAPVIEHFGDMVDSTA